MSITNIPDSTLAALSENRELRCVIADLRAENAELIKDVKRLDWMQNKLLRKASVRFPDMTFKEVNSWAITSAGDSLRDAVDACIEQIPPEMA